VIGHTGASQAASRSRLRFGALCPPQSMTSVTAINCVVASFRRKSGLDPDGEVVKESLTEPSLADEFIEIKDGWTMARRKKKSTYERLRDGERLKHWEHKEVARQFQSEDPGWEVVHSKVAGIYVGNESHFAGVDPRLTQQPVREFGSWRW
jgi:hypothetical protein